jgi:hypothetical protein
MVEVHPERTEGEYTCDAVRDEGDEKAAPTRQLSELNKRGREGWELVAVYPRQGWIEYVFKRPASIEIHTGVTRVGDDPETNESDCHGDDTSRDHHSGRARGGRWDLLENTL